MQRVQYSRHQCVSVINSKTMKRILLFLLLIAPPAALSGQYAGKRSRPACAPDPWEKKNMISFDLSAVSASAYAGVGILPVTIEYDHVVGRNFSVGAMGHYASYPATIVTDSYEIHEHFAMLGAKASYSLPIVRGKLYLKFGLGVGVGYHDIFDVSLGWVDQEYYERYGWVYDKLTSQGVWRLHLLADIHWIVRIKKRHELKLSPLPIAPSRFIFAPKGFDEPHVSPYFTYNLGITAGYGYRF